MNKRIVSMSIYGTSKLYLRGGLENITLIHKYYPGWIPRFYVAENCPALSAYEKEAKNGLCEVVVAPTWGYVEGSTVNGAEHHNIAHLGMTFRYDVLFDKDVDIALMRDADSRVGPRDAASAMEWLETDKTVHIIYDNPIHWNGGIMPGLAGWRADRVRSLYLNINNYKSSFINYLNWYGSKGYDAGLRFVHFDLHMVRELLVKPFGDDNIYRCGYNTPNPLKIPMLPEFGTEVGSVVNEEWRYEDY